MKKLILLFIFVTTISYAQQNTNPAKYALVIGNGAYTNLGRLNNPANDANDMAAALQGLGFTVDKVLDGSLDQMENAIMRLKNRLSVSKNSYGFFFYAGHGVQSGGVNYLVPVGASVPSENALRERAVSVQYMLNELNDAGNELNVIVLDACRDNPFSWARSGSRGLTVVSNQPADSIVVYATSAGSTAADGTGRNGLFTSHLLTLLRVPGLDVKEVFDHVGAAVSHASDRKQIPAIYSQYFGKAYLGSRPVTAMPLTPVVQPPPQPEPVPQLAPVAAVQPTPAPAVQPVPSPQPVPQPIPRPTPVAAIVPPLQQSMSVNTVPDTFVLINRGTFTMGSPANEQGRGNDEIQHQVTVNSFYMGKYEVTQKEYRDVMGTNPSYFKGNNLPVEGVSWLDAIEYCNKRSQKEGLTPAYTYEIIKREITMRVFNDNEGKWEEVTRPASEAVYIWNRNANGYRLPTEAEWEYACRAGTTTPFNTGNTITSNMANFNDDYPYTIDARGVYRKTTTPAGSFPANAWGLHDMHGNVWEWCWDWYGTYQEYTQVDPTGAASGKTRVVRGGTWNSDGRHLRSAERHYMYPSTKRRADNVGFRVARN
ncbi:MAG: SUMF1/EgtB/PvdO family nonheme iron enzyme [Treponema sp.]|nr:SUMF1/EgtB/PvdO family nonheme iron enzyme [Treponema sp.]